MRWTGILHDSAECRAAIAGVFLVSFVGEQLGGKLG
jgi:hypothetical protein